MTGEDADCLYIAVRGQGEPLLLIHGWPFDHRIFEPQIQYLSARFRVIAYDRRGFGRSPGTPSLAGDVVDVGAILDRERVESAHILGWSQGGRIALRFASLHPARVRSLVLQAPAVDSYMPPGGDDVIPLETWAEWARDGQLQRVRDAWLGHPMVDSGVESEALIDHLRRMLKDWDGHDLTTPGSRNFEFPVDVTAGVAAAGIPLLILTGAHETRARRAHAKHLLDSVPGAAEVVFANSGHLSNLTEAAKFNHAVEQFCLQAEKRRP